MNVTRVVDLRVNALIISEVSYFDIYYITTFTKKNVLVIIFLCIKMIYNTYVLNN